MTKYLPTRFSVHSIPMVRDPDWRTLFLFGKQVFLPTFPASPAVASREARMVVRDRKSSNFFACTERWRTLTKVLTGVALVALLWAPDDAAFAQQEEVIKSGQQLFDQKCAICHGTEGKGDGVLGLQLKKQPADLSRLSERNAGTFPFWQAYGKIDGRENIGAHGPGDMPVWGTDDQYEGTSGRLAMGQILQIVFFLQSIQE